MREAMVRSAALQEMAQHLPDPPPRPKKESGDKEAKKEKNVVLKEAKHRRICRHHLRLDILEYGGVVVALVSASMDTLVEELSMLKAINVGHKGSNMGHRDLRVASLGCCRQLSNVCPLTWDLHGSEHRSSWHR